MALSIPLLGDPHRRPGFLVTRTGDRQVQRTAAAFPDSPQRITLLGTVVWVETQTIGPVEAE